MDKNVAQYLGSPQRHALNRIHCKEEKKKKETTELIVRITAGIRFFFSCSYIILCLFIGTWWFPEQKVTADGFWSAQQGKKMSCPFWKLTWLNWHILISTFLKRISRLHYIYFRVVFHNVLLLKKKKKKVALWTSELEKPSFLYISSWGLLKAQHEALNMLYVLVSFSQALYCLGSFLSSNPHIYKNCGNLIWHLYLFVKVS